MQGACRFGGKKCEVVHICICENQNREITKVQITTEYTNKPYTNNLYMFKKD